MHESYVQCPWKNKFIWFGLIPQDFSAMILDVGLIMCIAILQDLFSNVTFNNIISVVGPIDGRSEVSPPLLAHPCKCVILCLDILLHYLTSTGFTKVPPVITDHIFQHLMSHERWSMFYFVAWYVSIGTKGWCRKQLVKLTQYRGTKWVVVPTFHLKMGKQTKSTLGQ